MDQTRRVTAPEVEKQAVTEIALGSALSHLEIAETILQDVLREANLTRLWEIINPLTEALVEFGLFEDDCKKARELD